MQDPAADGPATPVAVPLTDAERRRVWLAGLAPALLLVGVQLPAVAAGAATASDLAASVLVFGGLGGLTAAVVAHEWLTARHCPRCGVGNARGTRSCEGCGYDLAARPRFACERRHRLHLEPGLCACGRRLHPLPVPRGLGREVTRILWFGLWLLCVLVAVWFGLRLLA